MDATHPRLESASREDMVTSKAGYMLVPDSPQKPSMSILMPTQDFSDRMNNPADVPRCPSLDLSPVQLNVFGEPRYTQNSSVSMSETPKLVSAG